MRDYRRKIAILAVAAFALLAGRAVAWADDPALTQLLSGPPAHMGKELPAESYVAFEVRRLKRAKVLWRNVEALKRRGITVPLDDPQALATFDAEVLKHVGFVVYEEGMNAGDFLDETRTLWADRYGGGGLGQNNGSGRAGDTGEAQIKGPGPTPLVGNTGSHSHGGVNFREGQADIVMGEMFNRELPYGANRVLFAIDTGLNLSGEGRRMMLVREDPVRPAHFIKVPYGAGPSAAGDAARLRSAGKYLIRALPAVEGEAGKPEPEIFRMRMDAYVDRVAEQYAAAISKKLYHGATSPSNFMIDGRFIDFSTSSALLGYGPAQTLPHVEAFGELDEIVNDLVKELVLAANEYVSLTVTKTKKGKKGKIKTINTEQDVQLFAFEFESRFMKRFDSAMNRNFLVLAGFPEETAIRLGDSPEGQALASKLREMAFEPAEWLKGAPLNLKGGVPGVSTSKYDYAKVVSALAESRLDASARARVEAALPDEAVREPLSSAYDRFFASAMRKTPEVPERDAVSAMLAQIKERNRTLFSFFRDKVMGDANARVTSYLRYGNAMKFQRSMDEAVSSEGTRPPAFRMPERCELALIEFKNGWWKTWVAKAQTLWARASSLIKPASP